MTKVAIDIPDPDMWRIQQDAQRLGITPGDVVRTELAERRRKLNSEFRNRVRSRVLAKMCDADIATELGVGVTTIRDIRQKYLKLPANHRYRKNV